MKTNVSQPVLIVLIVVGFLVAGLGGYFVLIRPQHAKAASLDKQISDTNQAIDSARTLTLQAKKGAKIRVADIFRLTKAMPDQTDMPDILIQLNQVAEDSGFIVYRKVFLAQVRRQAQSRGPHRFALASIVTSHNSHLR